MWGGRQGSSSPDRYNHSSTNGSNGNGESPTEGHVAAALAARMAFANAYDTAPPAAAPSSFYDVYGGATAGQSSAMGEPEDAALLYAQRAQRARELELFHLQQQMQERQALENEARNRLLEHAARNQIQEYERTRIQLELMAEMQHRDREARLEAERSRLVQEAEAHANANAMLSQHDIDAAAAHNMQEQQFAEYLTKQQNQLPDFDQNQSSDFDQNQSPDFDAGNSPLSFAANDEEETSSALELKVARSPSPLIEAEPISPREIVSHRSAPQKEPRLANPAPKKEPRAVMEDSPPAEKPPPKVDPPKIDPPIIEQPKKEVPKQVKSQKKEPPKGGKNLKLEPPKSPKKDAPKKDAPKKDPQKKQLAKKDTPKKKDSPKKESPKMAAIKKDPPKKDPQKKDPATKVAPKKESSKKDPPKKDSTKKDSTKKDSTKKDSTKKESTKKESTKKESTKKESTKKDSTKKDSTKKDSSKKDSTKKDSTKKDPTKKDPPKKDPPKKEPTKKEPPKKDPPKKKATPKKEKSSSKKKSPQKEEASLKLPLETPSSSQLEPPEKITPPDTVSSSTAVSKKRKKTPIKTAGGAGSGSKSKKAKKSPGGSAGNKKSPVHAFAGLIKRRPGVPSMDDAVPKISDVQYANAEALMSEFCKVPFLAEFSRPVSLLHPELVTLYSKIIHHPMDLGHICRAIRRREYKNTRAIQLDVWRVFSNCVKFHMHPNARDNAIPSFISIAMHLRDFFNSLWQEYMMASDAPPRAPGKGISHVHSAFQKRAEARKERLLQVSQTLLTPKCLQKLTGALERFISSGGKVDKLDRDAILGNPDNATGDIATFIESLQEVIKTAESNIETGQEYTVLELHRDLKKCYTEDVFEHEILKKMKISQRLDRILGKTLAPIYEVSCRGVNQSSIWGCMAAAIWARESKKKPYWPGIVLGILAPDDQKEDWHQALTDRNEGRLPEKLRADLKAAKRRAELALKKQNSDLMSYFLVEFMGSHEFIWVKESDIIENFDPEEDVNIASAAGNITKKRRSAAFNTKQMTNAIEEGRWALEEFELQLNNTCGDRSDDEDDFNDAGYTFDILCQSDDEADEMDAGIDNTDESVIDEQNELLSSDGLLDFSIEGRKKAKARVLSMKKAKKEKMVKEKEREKEREKEKAKKAKVTPKVPKASPKDDAKKLERQLEMEQKREQKELDARRKKRARDHEKSLKELERKAKKKKSTEKKGNPNEVQNKRGRAEAVAKGFLVRKCIKDASFNGASFQPTASVEPSGLLGMALAFRAAAGEIPFLDNAGKPFLENSWDNIEIDSSMDSSERCRLLQEQIDLIGQEIVKVDASTQRRLSLVEDAKKAQSAALDKILEADEQVRATIAKKKKKSIKKASPQPDRDKDSSKGDHDVASADISADKPESQNETPNGDQDDQSSDA